jgi:heme exporter protein A
MTPPPAARPFALTVDGLALRRGERVLFTGLGFALAEGEALFVRGHNGAGKTTLLLAVAGIIRPDAGTIAFGGDPEVAPSTRMQLLGHQSGLKPRLTAAENLRFWQAIYGGREDGSDIAPALAEVGLAHAAGLPAGYLSAGQLRRLGLARLLVAPRPLWLLDEPTASLDVDGEALVARLLDAHLAAGGMALVATHQEIALARPPRALTLGGAP